VGQHDAASWVHVHEHGCWRHCSSGTTLVGIVIEREDAHGQGRGNEPHGGGGHLAAVEEDAAQPEAQGQAKQGVAGLRLVAGDVEGLEGGEGGGELGEEGGGEGLAVGEGEMGDAATVGRRA